MRHPNLLHGVAKRPPKTHYFLSQSTLRLLLAGCLLQVCKLTCNKATSCCIRTRRLFNTSLNSCQLAPLQTVLVDSEPQETLPAVGDQIKQLTTVKALLERHSLPPAVLTALWGELEHVGQGGKLSLFDKLFNPPSLNPPPRWDYYMDPVSWDPSGQAENRVDPQASYLCCHGR